jgi:hypothetical protein
MTTLRARAAICRFARPVAVALLVGVAACGGPAPSAGAFGPDGPSPTPIADVPVVATRTPRPTEVPGPPVASIILGGAPVRAELGSFSWDGLSSDAPWVIPGAIGVAARGQPLDVTLVPAMAAATWDAVWAPIRDGAPAVQGRVAGEGTGPIESLRAPRDPGDWSLRLAMRFAPGRSGTWYWHVAVVP